MTIWHWPLHVLLLGAYPVLFLFGRNQRELELTTMVLPLAITLVGGFALASVISLFTKNWLRGSLLASAIVTIFFAYPHLYELYGFGKLEVFGGVLTTSKIFNTVTLFVIIGITVLVLRMKNSFQEVTRVVNTISLLLVVASVVTLVGNRSTGNINERFSQEEMGTVKVRLDSKKPDIYYFIFDRYANESSLIEYGFDNQPFLDSLSDVGFHVVHKSPGNYPNTTESLASSLNMKYLDELAVKVGKESSSVSPLRASIEDNAVSEFLRARGYDFYNVGSWWGATRINSFAVKSYVAEQNTLNLDEFSTNLFLKNTPLGKLLARFFPESYTGHAERFEYQLRSIGEIAEKPETTYTFAHFLMPHDPYVFNADCSRRSLETVDRSTYQVNYLDQLQCTNTKILSLVKDILAKSDQPPLIIIQSDEGPHPILSPRTSSSWLNLPDQTYREKLRILNATYAPDDFSLPEGTTPVNTFRYVFNHYFGTNFEILPNLSYVFEREERPYRFVDVTGKVTFPDDK